MYRGSIFNFNVHFGNKLEGKIIIDNKEYYIYGYTDKSELTDILGSAYGNDQRTSEVFLFKMNDLDSISLIGVGEDWCGYEICSV